VGQEGRDFLFGGLGSDRVVGGEDGDWLVGSELRNAFTEILSGGDGDDILRVDNVPAYKDVVSCGRGLDRVIADRKDVVADDCERVRIVHGTEAEVLKQENAFDESIPPAVLEFFDTFVDRLAPDPTAG
jgi:hypothetical protein